jgi:hypothetical protein
VNRAVPHLPLRKLSHPVRVSFPQADYLGKNLRPRSRRLGAASLAPAWRGSAQLDYEKNERCRRGGPGRTERWSWTFTVLPRQPHFSIEGTRRPCGSKLEIERNWKDWMKAAGLLDWPRV